MKAGAAHIGGTVTSAPMSFILEMTTRRSRGRSSTFDGSRGAGGPKPPGSTARYRSAAVAVLIVATAAANVADIAIIGFRVATHTTATGIALEISVTSSVVAFLGTSAAVVVVAAAVT